MACSLKSLFCVSELSESSKTTKEVWGFSPSKSRACSVLSNDFFGKSISLSIEKGLGYCNSKTSGNAFVHAQATICVSKALQWWKKNLKHNMIEIHSAQQLIHCLRNAGDALVIVDFYSPGCGGCKALHPKICQIAEQYANAIFLKVNYEELKITCQSLRIHVLPFFKFYRGAEGRVCSFSCTISTIKKFKDALAKHGNESCSLGPAKGLDETELKILASDGEISVNSSLFYPKERKFEDLVMESHDFSVAWGVASNRRGVMPDNIIY